MYSLPLANPVVRLPPYEALRRAIALLVAPEPAPAAPLTGRPREDNAPIIEPDGLPGLRRLTQVIELLCGAAMAQHAVLTRLEEESSGLTFVATVPPNGLSGPMLGPRHAYPQLRQLVAAGELAWLNSSSESGLLTKALRLGNEQAVAVLPIPLPAPLEGSAAEPGSSDGGGWALLLFWRPPVSPLLGDPCPPLPSDGRPLLTAVAQLLGLALRGGGLDQTLRDQTRRINIQHLLPGHKPPALDYYREFFQSSADGIILLNAAGRVSWLNRAAEQMTGYATAGLAGHLLSELVPEPQQPALWYAVGLIVDDHPVPPFDLSLVTTSRETLVLSVSTSAVPTQPRYVVLSFRDVTEKRFLEGELRKTKEFLERLIDSTVDGIIAADISGQVVLFNRGAARITGYAPEEVIGELPVWKLYPGDGARRVMSELRAAEHGGVGRLTQSRMNIIGKSGQLIPVALSASIIYESDQEVATVGILSDLRERLFIEERLLKTEERLAWSEKQALVVELAGTAAHELNQPLTSVMGYAQLLHRQLPTEYSEIHEYAEVLVREAERMAEIVRKIGHITRYETKNYVGETRILDLDRAILPTAADSADYQAVEPPGGSRSGEESHDDGPLFRDGPAGPRSREP